MVALRNWVFSLVPDVVLIFLDSLAADCSTLSECPQMMRQTLVQIRVKIRIFSLSASCSELPGHHRGSHWILY